MDLLPAIMHPLVATALLLHAVAIEAGIEDGHVAISRIEDLAEVQTAAVKRRRRQLQPYTPEMISSAQPARIALTSSTTYATKLGLANFD